MTRLKNSILKIHQVTGIILCLMFFVWFVSGIVLIFVGFPHASREERFLHLKPFTVTDVQNILPLPDSIKGSFELEKQGDRPVYRVSAGKRAQQVFDACTLEPIPVFSEGSCRRVAESFLGCPIGKTVKIDRLDQWMPWSYYQPLLPIYKFYMANARHTVLYVSTKTGAIVQQTDRQSRWLARVGAIPHWIYFRSLRLQVERWNQVIIWISSIGLLVSLSGMIAGMIRLNSRKKRKRTGSITPYKKFWYKWHHLTGFFFGIFVFTFLLSGLFSVVDLPGWAGPANNDFSPAKIWDRSKTAPVKEHFARELWLALETKEGVRKIARESSMGKPAWFVYYDDYQVPEVYVATADTVFRQKPYTLQQITSRAAMLFEGTSYDVAEQTKYDNYYQESGMDNHPLPVYRISWNNAAQNRIYIDPVTGQAVVSVDKMSKIHRWLYQGLHKYNIQFLKEHEWLRKTLLIVLSLGGIVLSSSGVVLGWNRIKRKLKVK